MDVLRVGFLASLSCVTVSIRCIFAAAQHGDYLQDKRAWELVPRTGSSGRVNLQFGWSLDPTMQ